MNFSFLLHARKAIAGRLRVYPAIAISCAVLFGYAIGMITTLARLFADERGTSFLPANPYGNHLLFKRYPHARSEYSGEYAEWVASMVALSLWTLMLILCSTLAGRWFGRSAPLLLMPMSAGGAPRSSLFQIRGLWRAALRTSKPSTLKLIGLGVLLGLTGAWIGELSASVLLHLRYEAAWARGAPGTAKFPEPLFLWFALSDGLWVLGGAFLLTMLSIVIPARRHLIRSGELARRFCLSCGYPRPTETQSQSRDEENDTTRDLCPECGKRFVPIHGQSQL